MILADQYSAHPATPAIGSYEFYSVAPSTDIYLMFSDGIPRQLGYASGLNIQSYTASQSITNEDIISTSGAGAITLTLPSAIGLAKKITFEHSGAIDLVINCVLGQTINGAATAELAATSSITLFPVSGNWRVI